MELLTKLINNSDNLTEANAIAMLGTTYKQTGFHFDKRLEKFFFWGGANKITQKKIMNYHLLLMKII